MSRLSGFLSNDSTFGQIMGRCWILIGSSLMFAVFSIPVVTIGPSLAALYYVCLKVLRGDTDLNPIRAFWKGFRMNFKQGVISTLVLAAIAFVCYVDYQFCKSAGGAMQPFLYALAVLVIFVGILATYLFPVMAAFEDTLPHLIRNSFFFAFGHPLRILPVVFLEFFPLFWTYYDRDRLPLYAFLWVLFGFGLIAMLQSHLLIGEFKPYLPEVDEYGIPVDKDDGQHLYK